MLKKLLFASTCALASLCFLSEKTLAQIQWRCSTAGLNEAYGNTQQEAYNRSLSQCASNTPSAAGVPSPCQPQNVVCNQTGLSTPQPQPPRPQPPQPQPPQSSRLVPLKGYWSDQWRDNFSTATPEGERSAVASGYVFIRDEGCVFPTQQPGTVPLKLYWSPRWHDNYTTGTSEGENRAVASGYVFVRIEGYVYPSSTSAHNLGALTTYWKENDNYTTGAHEGASRALATGYSMIRTEGYSPITLAGRHCL